MRPEPERTAVLKVEIPNRNLARTLLEEWADGGGISLSILRGRLTAEKACYELKLEGDASEVARIIRQSAPWYASRRSLNKLPVGTPA